MSDTELYQALRSYDNFLLAGWSLAAPSATFEGGIDHVLRVVLHDWELDVPPAHLLVDLAKKVGATFAVTGELAGPYQVKGVALRHVPNGDVVKYLEPHTYTLPFGDSWNESLQAGAGTWTVDLVFQPNATEKSFATQVQRWKQYLANALAGSRGTPKVFVVGLMPLEASFSSGDIDTDVWQRAALSFWISNQAYWEYRRVPDAALPWGYSYVYAKVHDRLPDNAWASNPPYLGTGGYGIATGSAFDPKTLKPLVVAATTQVGPPVVPPGLGPPTGVVPPGGSGLQQVLAKAKGWEKAAMLVVGLSLGYLAARKLLAPRAAERW
jgi:hypothetical protein